MFLWFNQLLRERFKRSEISLEEFIPLLFGPNLNPIRNTDDDDVLLDVCVVFQINRDQNSPLLVAQNFGSTRKIKPIEFAGFLTRERKLPKSSFLSLPLFFRKDEETSIQTARDEKFFRVVFLKNLTEFCRNDHPVFRI